MSEITCPLWRAAQRFPNEPALVHGHRTISYADYDAWVTVVADSLLRSGIGAGDRVGLMGSNSIDYVIALMAVMRAGAIACPISYRYPYYLVDDIIESLKLKTVFIGHEVQPGSIVAASKAVGFSDLPGLTYPVDPAPRERTVSLSRYHYATIVQTSGSSGRPKAALHCYANHYYSAIGSNQNIPLETEDRWLLALPLFHVGGIAILFRCLLAGAAVVIADTVEGRPKVGGPVRCTHCSLVPTQMKRLLDDPLSTTALSGAKAILVGGAALNESLLETAYDAHWPIFTTYGMTETSSQLTTTEPGAPLQRLYTSGRLLPHRRLAISPEGEILAGGDTLFVGYVNRNRIDSAVDADGWFHTGDIGRIDSQGYLTLYGRRDNMFVSGGENVHPEAIERALRRLVDIEDAVVVPVPDDEFGARPFAFVRLASFRQFGSADSDSAVEKKREAIVSERCHSGELRTALMTELPRYMIPVMCAAWPLEFERDRLKLDRDQFRMLAEQIYNRPA